MLRGSDKLVHWGRNSWCCAADRPDKAVALARQLCLRLAEGLCVTAPIGVVAIYGSVDMGEAIRRADAALYLAKRDGRNLVEIATEAHAPA